MTTTIQEKNTYAIDAAHSSVEFIVRHMMLSRVRGRFEKIAGTIELTPGIEIPANASVAIETASIDTGESQRDAHLRSSDFFDAENFPEIGFAGTRVEGDGENFKLFGKLNMHGVTREIVLEGTAEGSGRDPWGNERVGFSAHAKINRKDFGLTWNQALETGGVLVSDEVRIELNVQAVLQK